MRQLGDSTYTTRQREYGMISSKRIKEIEQRLFEIEATLGIMEIYVRDIMQANGIKPNLDADKWYQK
jgi:hypothetical protein